MIKRIGKAEGFNGFYRGIAPAYIRAAIYQSCKLGLYEPIKDVIATNVPGSSILQKFLAGAVSGALGTIIGNPLDVVTT